MKQIIISRPVELVLGSGLDLRATVAAFGSSVVQSEVNTNTDSTDLTASIVTIIDLAVV